jgi:putative ABC transport system permease protein
MHFSTFIVKNIVRRPMRSCLTVMGVAVAVGAVVALVGISFGFERSFMAIYQKQKVDLLVYQAGQKNKQVSSLPLALRDKIAAVPGVKLVHPGLMDQIGGIDALEPIGALIQGWEADSPFLAQFEFESGRKFEDGHNNEVVLGKKLAITLDLKVGDELPLLEKHKFKVVGIADTKTVLENGMMFMNLAALQGMMGKNQQNMVTGFGVCVADNTSEEAIRDVQKRISGIPGLDTKLDVQTTKDLVNTTTEIRFIRAMAWVTSTIALFIGAIGMLNTMIMSVFERTKEIGVLRAIGWGRFRVVKMILMESILLSLFGGVVGTIGAMLLIMLLSQFPAAAGVVDSNLAPTVIFEGFLIALGVGFLGALYPAYRGAQLLPTEALRHE